MPSVYAGMQGRCTYCGETFRIRRKSRPPVRRRPFSFFNGRPELTAGLVGALVVTSVPVLAWNGLIEGYGWAAYFEALAFIGVVCGVIVTLRHFRLQRTWSYIERWNNPGFIESRRIAEQYFAGLEQKDIDGKRAAIDDLLNSTAEHDIEIRIHIDTVANLFTELGAAYKCGAITRDALQVLGPLVVKRWEQLHVYVERLRIARGQPGLHESFEEIQETVCKHEIGL